LHNFAVAMTAIGVARPRCADNVALADRRWPVVETARAADRQWPVENQTDVARHNLLIAAAPHECMPIVVHRQRGEADGDVVEIIVVDKPLLSAAGVDSIECTVDRTAASTTANTLVRGAIILVDTGTLVAAAVDARRLPNVASEVVNILLKDHAAALLDTIVRDADHRVDPATLQGRAEARSAGCEWRSVKMDRNAAGRRAADRKANRRGSIDWNGKLNL
jgi:hypothetical protein